MNNTATEVTLDLSAEIESGISFATYQVSLLENERVQILVPHIKLDDYTSSARFVLNKMQWEKAERYGARISFDYRGRGFCLLVEGCARIYHC